MSTLRGLAVPIGAVAAVLLVLLFNPWYVIEGDIRAVLTVAFWIAFVVLLVTLFEDRKKPQADEVEVEGPAFVRFLFHNTRAGLFWLPIRLFVGFAWLDAGWHKFTDPEWMQGGAALRAYWERAAAIPTSAPTIRPRPTASSPKTISLANQGCEPLSTRNWMNERYQS